MGGYCSASSAWRFEQGGDLSNGFGTWADVPHRGARVVVPGLGHDQLQRDALLEGTAQVWDLAGGAAPRALTGHDGWVTAVAVSADGRISGLI